MANTDHIERLAAEAVFSYKYDRDLSPSCVSTAPQEQRLCSKNKKVRLKHLDNTKTHILDEDTQNNNFVRTGIHKNQRKKIVVSCISFIRN